MPELPEVETIVKALKSKLEGKILKTLEILDKKIIKDKFSPQEFKNQKLILLQRKGKYIIFHFRNKKIIFYLGMTGKMILNSSPDKYTRIILKFNDDQALLQDKRKFSSIYFEEKVINKLGIEPLSKEFTFNYLKEKLNKSKQNIKCLLMDQKKIAGLGNIYAQEILFLSKINPFKKCDELPDKEIKYLYKNIQKILNKAIKLKGTTISDYRNAEDQEGKYQRELKVYGRENEPCFICNSKIKRVKQGGRSTYFCNTCQK